MATISMPPLLCLEPYTFQCLQNERELGLVCLSSDIIRAKTLKGITTKARRVGCAPFSYSRLPKFHNLRLVRALEVQGIALGDRDSGELGVDFVEYCFQAPANRNGRYEFSAAQLKTIQEVITLLVFCVFSAPYLREPLKWNYLAGFGLVIGAVFLIYL